MDARLYRIRNQRPTRLLRNACPQLAAALIDVIERRGRIFRFDRAGMSCVYLDAPSGQILVRGDDWAKIVPYIDGTADGVPANLFGPKALWTGITVLDAAAKHAPPAIRNPETYTRILNILVALFPESYPTSNL